MRVIGVHWTYVSCTAASLYQNYRAHIRQEVTPFNRAAKELKLGAGKSNPAHGWGDTTWDRGKPGFFFLFNSQDILVEFMTVKWYVKYDF